MPKKDNPFSFDSFFEQFAQSAQSTKEGSYEVKFPQFLKYTKRALTFIGILFALLLVVSYWWFHPAISVYSTRFWEFLLLFILAPAFVFFKYKSFSYRNSKGSFIAFDKTQNASGARVLHNKKKAKLYNMLASIPLLVLAFVCIGWVLSLAVIPGNAYKYAHVLETQEHSFASDIKEVNYEQIPVIDRESAVLLGNRTMGAIPEYVSQFEISPLYSQINLNGSPTRVSPLVYADLYKWFINREPGIPAYVKVDMATQDTEIVRLEHPIRYSQSEPFLRNIDRHVQLSYPFYLFDEKSFEVDDEGTPWWICPVQKRTIGLFGGTTIDRVVLCNASTGECFDYDIKDCPAWVDRAYPAELLIEQYNWSGMYKDGWLNSWLGQQGVVQTTPGNDKTLGYNYIAKDDDVWVYTGVTSATADNSIIGFVLINQRTHESHFYSIAGATEESAMRSAEGQVQNLRYKATFPLLLNINDQPTYFMALKDEAGLVKQYAMIDIQRYQNVAVGDTVSTTQKSYLQLLAAHGEIKAGDSEINSSATGKIRSINQAVIEGNTHFYITLEGEKGIFDFALPALLPIVSYRVGDEINFSYTAGDPLNLALEIQDS